MTDQQKPLSERVRCGEFRLVCLGEGIGWVTNPDAEDDIADEIAALEARLCRCEAERDSFAKLANSKIEQLREVGQIHKEQKQATIAYCDHADD